MGSLASPLMIPGAANPSGTNVSMPAPFSGAPTQTNAPNPYMPNVSPGSNPTSTANPYAGSFGAYGFPGSPAPTSGAMTSTAGGSAPTTPTITGIGQTGQPLTPSQQNSLNISLGKDAGAGMGTLIEQFLNSGAGYNPQVLQQLIAQLQPQFAGQQQDLLQQFSGGGNRFGSGAQTGYADLLGQQSQTEGSIAANLYEQSVQNYMNVLENAFDTTTNRVENTPSTFDDIMSALSTVGNLGSQGANADANLAASGAI
jgi:hypothetical protein